MESLKKINTDTLLWAGFSSLFFFLPVATSPRAICGVFVVGVWIAGGTFLKDLSLWMKSDMRLPLFLLIVLPWVGLLRTPVPSAGLDVAFKTHHWLFSLALMPLLARATASDRSDSVKPDILIKMFLGGLALNSTISILQFLGLLPLKRGLPIGLLGGDSAYIPFGLLLTTGILTASFYFSRARSAKVRFLYAFIMLQYFVTLSITGARSAYLALIVLSPLMAYNLVGKRHILKIAAGSVVIISLLFASPQVQSRVSKIQEDLVQYRLGNVNTSIGLRLHMWEIAISEIKKHPILGLGTAGYQKSWEDRKKDPSLSFFIHGNPHNSFLYMTVSFGIAGLISFCWLLFLLLKKGWRGRESPLGFVVFVFTVVFFVASLVDTPLLSIPMSTALALCTGMAGALDG